MSFLVRTAVQAEGGGVYSAANIPVHDAEGEGVGLNRAVRHVASEWMTRSLDEIARLVYRLDDLPFLVGWIRIMQR
jgi:hypothetical protein